MFIYDAQHYLVVSVPVRFTMETDASDEEHMLAFCLRLDFKLAVELSLEIDETFGPTDARPRWIY